MRSRSVRNAGLDWVYNSHIFEQRSLAVLWCWTIISLGFVPIEAWMSIILWLWLCLEAQSDKSEVKKLPLSVDWRSFPVEKSQPEYYSSPELYKVPRWLILQCQVRQSVCHY